VASYLGHVHFGFLACPDLLSDVDALADDVPDALAGLVDLAGGRPEPAEPAPPQLAAAAR
jgi:hypothetical protein